MQTPKLGGRKLFLPFLPSSVVEAVAVRKERGERRRGRKTTTSGVSIHLSLFLPAWEEEGVLPLRDGGEREREGRDAASSR